MIGELDCYLNALYPAESNHLLSPQQLLADNVRFMAARRGDQALGMGALLIHPSYGEIKRVYVAKAARGQGIARLVLEGLIAQARAESLPLLRLETGIHQPEALSLFAALGFKRIGPFGAYPDDPLSIFMEMNL